jgi:hypothetical protein
MHDRNDDAHLLLGFLAAALSGGIAAAVLLLAARATGLL